MKFKYLIFLVLISFFLLSSCMNIATTGAQAVYNQHSIKKNLNDEYISFQAYKKLNPTNLPFHDANISVATYNGEVLLAGQVPKPWQKTRAEQIIKGIPDVKTVYNTIDISGASSTLEQISDAWITTKIKAKLIASDEVDATQIKVVTENGTVYLMGVLLPEEADFATELAQDTDGVKQVVKLFSYVSISKQVDKKELTSPDDQQVDVSDEERA